MSDFGLPPIIIDNVVVSTKARRPFDLELLATRLQGVIYEPQVFCGLIYRRRKPQSTVTMFSTGTMTSTGCRSEASARQSLRMTASEIADLTGERVLLARIKTQNVVAGMTVGYPMDIEKFATLHHNAIYEPERFPGVICRLEKRRNVVVLLFGSGKVVSAGSKSEYEAGSSIRHAYAELHRSGCIGNSEPAR